MKRLFVLLGLMMVMMGVASAEIIPIANTSPSYYFVDCGNSQQHYINISKPDQIRTDEYNISRIYSFWIYYDYTPTSINNFNNFFGVGTSESTNYNQSSWNFQSTKYVDNHNDSIAQAAYSYGIGNLTQGAWHNIITRKTIVGNQSRISTYIDGVKMGASAAVKGYQITNLNANLGICADLGRISDGRFYWNGSISNLKIYNVTRNEYFPDDTAFDRLTYDIYQQEPHNAQDNIQIMQLNFHNIYPTTASTEDDFNVTEYDAILGLLYNQSYRTINYQDLYNFNNNITKYLPKKSLMIVHDDGYYGEYINTNATLVKYGYKAIIAVITNTTDLANNTILLNNTIMNWSTLKLASEDGYEIISHSVTHLHQDNATQCDATCNIQQYNDSYHSIVSNIGIIPYGYVYPFNIDSTSLRSVCNQYYPYCTGFTYYFNRYPSLNYPNMNFTNHGISRVSMKSYNNNLGWLTNISTPIDRNLVLHYSFANESGGFSDKSGYADTSKQYTNIKLNSSSINDIKTFTDETNSSIPFYIYNYSGMDSLVSYYDTSTNIAYINSSGGDIELRGLTSPYNDIKNTSNGVILAADVTSYSTTLQPNQQIEVGDFVLENLTYNYDIDNCFATLKNSSLNSTAVYFNYSRAAISYSRAYNITNTGLVAQTTFASFQITFALIIAAGVILSIVYIYMMRD